MADSADLSDGSQQAHMVSGEDAETKFGADQAETNMVKLVDGKLTSFGDTEDDVVDEQLRNRYSSDEERGLQGDQFKGKIYENSDAALQVGEGINEKILPDDPAAEAEITGNPDAGDTVNTGLPSEDDSKTPTNTFAGWSFGNESTLTGSYIVRGDMIPQTPGAPPDPTQPVPGIPETPPTPPTPGPEIPDLPGTPRPTTPEIQEPSEPDRSHEVNAQFVTLTSSAPGVIPTNGPKPESVAPTRREHEEEAAKAAPGSKEGMTANPETGPSKTPYDPNAKAPNESQPGERPEEAQETKKMPREMMDESTIEAQDMISGTDRSDQKSTDGLDRNYNDPEAARDMAT